MKRAASNHSIPCPCGATATYAQCCGLWHAGAAAPDAERLMRSRYCAFALALDDYLLATWHASARPLNVHNDSPSKFFRLEVKRHTITGPDSAEVEFVAWYKLGGRAQRMHEISRFVREYGRWWYVDGAVTNH